jgi:hypothetical protein
MKKINFSLFTIFLLSSVYLFAQTPSKDPNSTKGTTISNAGKAKAPKGTLTFKMDGKSMTASENTVQTMFIGMGMPEMAQGMISGRGGQFSISATFMTAPKEGVVPSKNIAGMPSVGFALILNGEQFNNDAKNPFEIKITKITKDGNNYYTAGTFSGKLTSIRDKSKIITISDGLFQSGHL